MGGLVQPDRSSRIPTLRTIGHENDGRHVPRELPALFRSGIPSQSHGSAPDGQSPSPLPIGPNLGNPPPLRNLRRHRDFPSRGRIPSHGGRPRILSGSPSFAKSLMLLGGRRSVGAHFPRATARPILSDRGGASPAEMDCHGGHPSKATSSFRFAITLSSGKLAFRITGQTESEGDASEGRDDAVVADVSSGVAAVVIPAIATNAAVGGR